MPTQIYNEPRVVVVDADRSRFWACITVGAPGQDDENDDPIEEGEINLYFRERRMSVTMTREFAYELGQKLMEYAAPIPEPEPENKDNNTEEVKDTSSDTSSRFDDI